LPHRGLAPKGLVEGPWQSQNQLFLNSPIIFLIFASFLIYSIGKSPQGGEAEGIPVLFFVELSAIKPLERR